MYELNGTIKLILETQTFNSGFMKREFVVTTPDDKYPQDVKFEVVKDKCALLDQYEVGQFVTVSFDVRGNEYNGKYYVNLNCWKLTKSGDGGGSAPPATEANQQSNQNTEVEPSPEDLAGDDEIPF